MKRTIILVGIFLMSCGKNNNSSVKNSNLNEKKINNIIDEVSIEHIILENDTTAYNKAFKEYVINKKQKQFLYYAILMAEKNNYKSAYQDISSILEFTEDDPLKYDSKLSLYSLLKAYEMDNKIAAESVKYIYTDKGKKIPKSSSVYCK